MSYIASRVRRGDPWRIGAVDQIWVAVSGMLVSAVLK
jgi:hypothetical protein